MESIKASPKLPITRLRLTNSAIPRCDSIESMRAYLPRLRTRLSSDHDYFRSVYIFTFDFARSEGQRSLATDSAIAFWQLLLPIGLSGRALAHIDSGDGDSGWKLEYNDWWFEFLNDKGGKGISKDTWHMVRALVTR
jgi:DCN1-like protein 1/2